MSKFKPIEKEKLKISEQIAAQLRAFILGGKLLPGDKLPPERTLAGQFKVTRTTLREALKKLEQLKLVNIRQGEGATVLDYTKHGTIDLLNYLIAIDGALDIQVVRGILEARTIIGAEIAKLAAQRAELADCEILDGIVQQLATAGGGIPRLQELDFDFFHALARASRNLAFVFLFNSIRRLYLSAPQIFELLVGHPADLAANHRALAAAIRAHDAEAAARLARDYLGGGANRILPALQLQPQEAPGLALFSAPAGADNIGGTK